MINLLGLQYDTRRPSARMLFVALWLFGFLGNLSGQEKESLLPGKPDTTIVLGEISVEALKISTSLRDVPGSISVVTGKEITLSDATNLATTLNALPGVSMQTGNYATSRIVIRGMGSRTPYNTNRIKSYLNEVPLTGSDGVSTPEEIDLHSLQSIEVVKGPAAALFGPGLGGSLNLYTPEYDQYKLKANMQYGSWQTLQSHLSATAQGETIKAWGSLSHLQSDGFRENNHYKRSSLLSTAAWEKPGWTVQATLLLTGLNAGIPSSLGKSMFEENPGAAAPTWKAVKGYKESEKIRAGITVATRIKARLDNHFTIFGIGINSYERRPFNNLDDNSIGYGFRNKLSYHTEKTVWIAGGEFVADRYEWQLDKENILLNKNNESRNHFNLYGMVYYRPNEKLNLSVASALGQTSYRLTDLFPANGEQSGHRKFPLIFSPRIGINYTLNPAVALYGSAGHGYSLPSPEETLLPSGDVNPNLEPEQGMQYETGIRLNLFHQKAWMEGTLYWIELNNLQVTKRVTEDIFTGINAGKTRHQGFELTFRNIFFSYNHFPGRLTSLLSYSLTSNKFITFTDDGTSYDGNHLPGIPNQTIQQQFTWNPVERIELTTQLYYVGEQYLDDLNSEKYGSSLLGNLKLSAEVLKGTSSSFQFFAGINNLTNTHYASMLIVNAKGFGGSEPRYYYPGSPRNFFLGIQYGF
ncbi:MAG: TonB-dependent receptor [Prolixibacteraceae bacterium]|jgi:iron complex outermembrane receptor protein|nr:TonB-dependent receptor [Prolixibacteraceae bacterium]